MDTTGKGIQPYCPPMKPHYPEGPIGGVTSFQPPAARGSQVMSKRHFAKENMVDLLKGEQETLARVRHPYLVGLRWAWQTSDRVSPLLRGALALFSSLQIN